MANMSTLSLILIASAISTVFCAQMYESDSCETIMDECLLESPYIIRQYDDEGVMSWNEARELCFDSHDKEVDGMATLDTSSSAISSSSLDEQFAVLREICSTLTNADGRKVNCWVGGTLNDTRNGYIFSSTDTNRLDYTPPLLDPTRWGCVRNKDGSCLKDIEGQIDNDEDYLVLFQNRDYYLADWSIEGGTNPDFQVTAVVCNNKAFSYNNRCQCSCNSCDIYGDVHINTFDGVPLHAAGQCAYYAVTPCDEQFNEDFPIEISVEHTQCFDGLSTCLRALFVSFYDKWRTLQSVIKFEHILNETMIETVATYIDEGALQLSGDVPLNEAQIWMDDWSFLLSKQNKEYNLGIWTDGLYQTARIYFRDLYGLSNNSLSLSSARITLSSCFVANTCGICGYYDGDMENELMLRWEGDYIHVDDPFNINPDDIIQFTMSWIHWDRSIQLNEECNEYEPANLCQIDYCNDECLCDSETLITYNNSKRTQCNFDVAACLGLVEDTLQCKDFLNKDNTEQGAYIEETAPHCAYLVDNYCCYHAFCSTTPDYCLRDATPTEEPTSVTVSPTHAPTTSPTDPPSLLPTLSPTSGPTKPPSPQPTMLTGSPTVSPITDSLCSEEGIDIVFLVDNSCGLDVSECKKRQHGISELIASIKDGIDPRISYMTFSDRDSVDTLISLDDIGYNMDINKKNRRALINYIKGLDCGAISENTELLYGVNGALDELRERSGVGRDKKIVIISHCEDSTDTFDPCSLMDGDALVIDDKYVEITVVNIDINNIMTDTYLQCLTENEPERFIVIADVDKGSFDMNIGAFVAAVCESDTRSPTEDPTLIPTQKPTTKPTASPSLKPTVSPLEKACDFDYEADVVFVVDIGCGFNEEECGKQQELLSDLLQSIKTSNQPRIGYIDCDEEHSSWIIRLNNAIFNHPTELPKEEMLRELYFKSIRDRLPCNAYTQSVVRMECITDALNEFKIYSNQNSAKKMVIYSACASNDDVCLLQDAIQDQNIEVVLINIGDENKDENTCLSEQTDKHLVYTSTDINNEEITKSITKKVMNALCKEPTTQPTATPSTLTPTDKPTPIPTKTPTARPTPQPIERTKKPTLSPQDAAASIHVCQFTQDTDVMFVVDSTCGLQDEICIHKREFIAYLVESIKVSHNPRVALLECGDSFGSQYTLKLSDTSFNNINDNTELSAQDRDDLYLNKIETRLQCLSGSGVPKQQCLHDAVSVLKHESDSTRIRKIVYLQICENTEAEEECSDKSEVFNDNIEIIMVHIGDMISSEYNDCLYWNGPYTIYRFDDFELKTRQDIEIKNNFITHICTSNAFSIGEPSNTPTPSPTVSTTTTSTKTTTKCIPSKLAPYYRHSSSSSIKLCDDSSDSSDVVPVVGKAPTRRDRNKWPTKKPTNKPSKSGRNNKDKTWNKKSDSDKEGKGKFNWDFKANSRKKDKNKNKNKTKNKNKNKGSSSSG